MPIWKLFFAITKPLLIITFQEKLNQDFRTGMEFCFDENAFDEIFHWRFAIIIKATPLSRIKLH